MPLVKQNKTTYRLLLLVIILIIFILAYEITLKTTEKTTAIVSKIIDGDTINLQGGEKVRLLGINAPEKGQWGYEKATDRLKELIENKEIILEKDIPDTDQYGRVLRYIFLNGENINVKMVKEGLATVYILSSNRLHETELKEAENYAKNLKINIWKPPTPGKGDICNDACIEISYFHWDAAGNDCDNLNDEYVIFKNGCSYSCNLTNWSVKDESSRKPYIFPIFILERDSIATLYSGCGTNTRTQIYWCGSGHSCNTIWNNNGDTLYLRNSWGELVLSQSYVGY